MRIVSGVLRLRHVLKQMDNVAKSAECRCPIRRPQPFTIAQVVCNYPKARWEWNIDQYAASADLLEGQCSPHCLSPRADREVVARAGGRHH